LKRLIVPRIYGLADTLIAPSPQTEKFFLSIGIPQKRIFVAPFSIDNDYFAGASSKADRSRVRKSWAVPMESVVVLFPAKLQPWKRPKDVLKAFACAGREDSFLIIAGDGPLRSELEDYSKAIKVSERVRFLGFVNQSRMPEVYAASDFLVLSSEHENWGLVVNEGMACGLPVVVSDRVGARHDLVEEGEAGFVFPMGDVDRLTEVFCSLMADAGLRERLGEAARARMRTWSYRENIDGYISAIYSMGEGAQ
jgi:glycosyltransferase involved in cell wall biosynthesis